MKIIFFSTTLDIVDEWKSKYEITNFSSFDNILSLQEGIKSLDKYIILADYDSIATDINKMISSNQIPKNLIILERNPEVVTGKFLIAHGAKAYGNSRMLSIHYKQMIHTVSNSQVWTYPELTAALATHSNIDSLSTESLELLSHRLSAKEVQVIFQVLEGLTNDAIAVKLGITTRTVKAHMSSIFAKLHVNDRLSLVLLLK